MKEYSYSGPVMLFSRCIMNCWRSVTWAVSEKKARSNLVYRFKQEFGYSTSNCKISLPGKLTSTE